MAIGRRRSSRSVCGLLLALGSVALSLSGSSTASACEPGSPGGKSGAAVHLKLCSIPRTASLTATLAIVAIILVALTIAARRRSWRRGAAGEAVRGMTDEQVVPLADDATGEAVPRLEADDAIALANERTALALQAGRMGTFDVDMETGVIHNSPERLAIFGIDPATFDGRLDTLDALVHPDDIMRVRENRRLAQAAMTPFETEFRIIRPDGKTRWVLSRARAYRGADGTARFVFGVTMDVTERKRVERQLAEAAQQSARQLKELEALYASAPIGLALFDRHLKSVRINSALAGMYGHPPTNLSDRSVREALGPIAESVEPRLRRVIETGEAMLNVEVDMGSTHEPSERRFFRLHSYPLLDEGSLIAGVGLIVEEITDDKRFAERQMLLTRELRHRANNMLAVIQSVARRSLAGDRPLAEARVDLIERLQALARAHNMVTESDWQGAALEDLVRLELEGFDDRATITGPHVVLGAGPAQTFALVLHELAINALEHGALSVPHGRVAVTWGVTGAGEAARFSFRWEESGGPTVAVPARRGFGTELLERAIVEDFDKPARIQFLPAGLVFDIDVPYAIVRS